MSANPENISKIERPRADGLILHPKALWSYADISLYSRYEYNYVVNTLSMRPGFPKPIRVSGATGQPRFIAGDVMAWFEGYQERER